MFGHSFKEWFMATRPWSFPASAMPVAATLAFLFCLQYDISLWKGLWALLNVVAFHAAGNTWSDYNDYRSGVDREDTIGGLSIVSGKFTAAQIKIFAIILFAISSASGILLVAATGLPVLYIGILGLLLAVAYPWTKYHALGDVNIFLTYSLLPIIGISYVATGQFHCETLWLAVPIGLITMGILHINNTRDIEQDNRAGIKTFAMLIGKKASVYVYCFEMIFPFVWIVAGALSGIFPTIACFIVAMIKPAIDNCRKVMQFPDKGAEALYGTDEQTAKLQLLFSMTLVLLFVITGIFR